MTVAFVGPGLPTIPDLVKTHGQDAVDGIPSSVKQYATENNFGVSLFNSPQDQSTCSHLKSTMAAESTVKNGRCHFYEPFSVSNWWVLLDETLTAPEAGTYKIAVYSNGYTAKASFACCNWPEDFLEQFTVPDTECDVCGSDPAKNPGEYT